MEASDLDFVVDVLEAELRPDRDSHHTYRRLPATGRPRAEILAEMRELAAGEEPKWQDGFASGAVYHGGSEHIGFLNDVYAINSQANPLHPELWPSAVKYDAEIVAMTGSMLGGGEDGVASVCGTVSSGGTESILPAMRTYRDRAAAERGISDPEMIVPLSAHAAFDKASQYFGIRGRCGHGGPSKNCWAGTAICSSRRDAGTPGTPRRSQIRSKLRASSQSVTTWFALTHS